VRFLDPLVRLLRHLVIYPKLRSLAPPHTFWYSAAKTACPGPDKIPPNFLCRLREFDLAITVSELDDKQHVEMIRSPGGLIIRKLGALGSRGLCG
jgi:hypothetical protein